jgi:ADP-ribosylglycohydrolase
LLPPLTGKYNAFAGSDGAARRAAPFGIVFAGDPQKAAEAAKVDAEISHYGEGVWGAQAVAAAVATAMTGASFDAVLNSVMETVPKDSWLSHALTVSLDLVRNRDFLDVWMSLHDLLRTSSWSTTAEAIPAAFACMELEHGDFRRGMLLAGNFARDADTIGAVAGAVLGARYGADGIPDRWKEIARRPTGICLSFTAGLDIQDVARDLAETARRV